ncbi:omega-hydroxypalmitate O-feruloyl transferase-like [Phragmites australis]|uniref:omega-hydroxypalmitate O-feruloyl transferase-like n=1 Tax=Phragmites australis TaxID=29695 RepID=UPI002D770558|nr:omega-hydroxypalmitate O-feruloyl transferase-like [Phragmites australis]
MLVAFCGSLNPNVPTNSCTRRRNPCSYTPLLCASSPPGSCSHSHCHLCSAADPTPAMVQETGAVELRIRQQGEPSLVLPAEETHKGLYFLSNLDQNIAVIVQTVYCFRADDGSSACDVLRESLAKVLVPYYPLAGRLTISGEGKLVVDCTGEGAVFVEAEADCAMADIGDVTEPDPTVLGKLVYSAPGAKNILEMPLLAAQVTKFKCGGFVLGLAINHCMFDGVGAMQFINSWGETARGLPLSVPPALDRAVLRARDPPQVAFPHHEFAQIADDDDEDSPPLLHRSFRFTPASIARVKALVALEGARACTTFEALAGFVWSARTRALGMGPSRQSKLLFAVDGRPRFSPPLPAGYFGNAIVLTSATCAAGELVASLPRAVRLVRGAVEAVTDAYMRSAVDYFEATRARPSLASTLLITAWSRLPFRAADFGWGPPEAYGPAALPEKEVALFLSCGEEGGGVRVLLGLPAAAMAEFERLVEAVMVS